MNKQKIKEVYAIWLIAVITIFFLMGILALVSAKSHFLILVGALVVGVSSAIIICDKCERLVKSLKA